jgi:hypothetical protein
MKNAEFILMFRKGKARNINNLGSKTCIEVNNITKSPKIYFSKAKNNIIAD